MKCNLKSNKSQLLFLTEVNKCALERLILFFTIKELANSAYIGHWSVDMI